MFGLGVVFTRKIQAIARLAPSAWYRSDFEQVLGTSLELQIKSRTAHQAALAEDAALGEIERLERIFSRFEQTSELNRFLRAKEPFALSPELRAVLLEVEKWQALTAEAFHVAADALGALWKDSASQGKTPSSSAIATLCAQMRQPLWVWTQDRTKAQFRSALTINLNAIAKGFIVDRASEAACGSAGVSDALVNIGGDLRHIGPESVEVQIANPFSKSDNIPAIVRVRMQNQGLATSGTAHRGFWLGGEWHPHLFDPRTGQPIRQVAAASVLADNTLTADVLATALSVLGPKQGLLLCQTLPRVGCFLVDQDGKQYRNEFWQQHELTK